MRIKTMEKVLAKKFNEFLESIKDEKVKALVKDNTIITGGCFVSLWMNEEVNDFDLYFRNQETVVAVAAYYVAMRGGPIKEGFEVLSDNDGRVSVYIKSSGVLGPPEDKEKRPKFYPVYFTSNSVTLSDKIQLITRFYGSPEDIHKNYDFIHCINYWDSKTGKVTMTIEAMDAMVNKVLIYQGSKYPICSIIRTRKFIQRGWKINAGQYLKMCMQVNDFDLTDIEVLKDQLVGVDSAYFNHLIDLVEQARDEGKAIDNIRIIDIIDEVFD